MAAYFCEKTGVRIVAPGMSKDVDPVNGKDECREFKGEIVLKPAGGWDLLDSAFAPKAETSEKPARAGSNNK